MCFMDLYLVPQSQPSVEHLCTAVTVAHLLAYVSTSFTHLETELFLNPFLLCKITQTHKDCLQNIFKCLIVSFITFMFKNDHRIS